MAGKAGGGGVGWGWAGDWMGGGDSSLALPPTDRGPDCVCG